MKIMSPAPRLVKKRNRATLILAFIFYLQASWGGKKGFAQDAAAARTVVLTACFNETSND